MQAEAGLMSMTGEPDGPPARCGLSVVDFHTGSHMAIGLLAGIMGAMRTGVGCEIDVALFDTALHQMSYPATWYLNEGVEVGRLPRGAHPSIAPSQLFKTADGWLMLMCQTPKFWEIFCIRTQRQDLMADARFATVPARRENLGTLTTMLDSHLISQPTAHWITLLGGHVPVAPINDIGQALTSDHVRAIGMTDAVDHPMAKGGKLGMLAGPIKVNGQRPVGKRAPKLGDMT
jgi:crotonobetainyl-CoA:carnitine CoA-transferase CaiB-like acyl-CoA transferase